MRYGFTLTEKLRTSAGAGPALSRWVRVALSLAAAMFGFSAIDEQTKSGRVWLVAPSLAGIAAVGSEVMLRRTQGEALVQARVHGARRAVGRLRSGRRASGPLSPGVADWSARRCACAGKLPTARELTADAWPSIGLRHTIAAPSERGAHACFTE